MLSIHRTPIAVAVAIALATGLVWAQEAELDHGPYLVAPLIKTAPQIDGALDDDCWKDATWHEADQLVGKQGTSDLATRFAVARDGAHIYIAVHCKDPNPGNLVAAVPADERDGEIWKDDHVRIFLSPLCTAKRVFELQVNPNGAVRDMLISPEHPDGKVAYTFRSKTGQPHTASRVTDDGYTVEIGIWRRKSFEPDRYRVPIAAGEAWLFNVSRHILSSSETETVSSWTGALHDTSRYGSLMMGPTEVALTRPRFGNGHVGIQPFSAVLTNLSDEKQTLDVKGWGEAAGWRYWMVYYCKDSGVGPAFTTQVVLGPGQSARVTGELNVLTAQHDIKMIVEARKAGQSAAVAHVEHFFIARSNLDLHLHETEVDTDAAWLDVYMSSDLPKGQTKQATVSFWLRDEAGEAIGTESLAPFRGGRREVGYYLPGLAPGKYALHGRLVAEDGRELASTVSPFSVRPPEAKPVAADPEPSGKTGTIDLGLRELAGSTLRNQPVTFGVPFPDGLLASPEALSLADDGGNPIPFRARTTARWRRSNYVKWVLVDALVDGPAGTTTPLQLRYGTENGGSHSAGTFGIDQTGKELVVTTGPMRFSAAQGNGSLIDRIWIDRNGDGHYDEDEALTEPGAGLAATMTHEDGTIYRANMGPGAGLKVEDAGPFSVLLKAEGWFELPRAGANPATSFGSGGAQSSAIAQRLCKYVIRIRATEGSSELRVHHTFVFTEDSWETRLADIALTTRLAGAVRESDFGVFAREGASHLSLLQHGSDDFAVFEPDEGLQKPLHSDKKAPGWAALATDRGEVLAGVRDFWQLYPKELEVEDSELRLHIWPAHGKPHRPMEEVTDANLFTLPWNHEGDILDFQTPERYREFKIGRDYGLEQHALKVSFGANAIGLAKTHEITLSFSGDVRDRRERAALGRLVQEPPVCTASPEWMCNANTFGTVKMNPVDRARFPRIEAALEGWFDCESRLTEFLKAYGMFNYLDAHNSYYFNLRRVSWWRVWTNTHHGGPRVAWLQFGRSGEPKYLRAAHRRALNHMDVDTCHHTNPHFRYHDWPTGKIKGALNDYKGLVHWNSGNRIFDYNTMVDYLFYDYYLTGNRRALDVALEWGEAILKLSPGSVPGNGRGGAGVLAALCFLYEETGDRRYLPYLRSGGERMLSSQMDDGYFEGFWTTYAPWRGRYVLATDGDAAARDSLRRWCDNVTDWRYNDSVETRPQGTSYSYLDTFPISEDLASGYFLGDRNVDYARLALGVLQMFSWGMYEGDEYPEYRGWNGIAQFSPTLKSYISQTAPYALRAIADCAEPIEPLYRRTAFRTGEEGLTAYLDVPQDAVLHISAVISLSEGGEYQLALTGAAERTYGPVPITIKAGQNPQLVEWRSPEPIPAGEWKLTIAGKKGGTLVRLTVPEAKRITYRLPFDERFYAPAIYFLAPETPGKITWQLESRANEANGAVLIDPTGKWAGRSTWLDIDKTEWHSVEAEVTAEHAGKPWLFGSRQYRALLRASENVPPYFAMTRDAIFIPKRP